MKEIFHKACLPNRALIGGLFFDEVKIKEGLVWDPSSWEIIGFTDLGTEDSLEDDNDNHLATHILQFHFKSLFHNFSYPCAYFLTRNITADKLNRIFWLGVSMLQLQKFDIIVACCDGASENRKFINMNITKDKPYGFNPLSGFALFFFSDPPHLIKKLRNNLFNSGFNTESRNFKRLLELDDKYCIWQHIIAVRKRETKRLQPITKLKHETVYLDSLRKMRVKLAVNALHESVSNEMREHGSAETVSTQKYCNIVSKLWQSLNSKSNPYIYLCQI